MSVEFFVRAILIASLALFTSACGGGGGGSDAAPSNNTDTDENIAFTATQHELLPLIQGATITYDDGQTVTVTKDDDLSDETTTIYAVDYGDMVQYFSSTPDQISLHGVDGTFSIPDVDPVTNISFNNIRFSPPISIWKDGQIQFEDQINTQGTATALLSGTAFSLPVSKSINANVLTTSLSQWSTNNTPLSTIGSFQSKEIKIIIEIEGEVIIPGIFSTDFDVTLKDTLNLVPGLGIVSRNVDYTGDYDADSAPKFTHTISAVNELPYPITFEKSGASPTPSIPQNTANTTYDQDAIFNLPNGTDISSDQYNITNMTDINTAGWVNITKDDINKNYMVEILVNENTPASSTSILVMFEHKTSGKELPANVNLIANP